jgi:hypothetical protein
VSAPDADRRLEPNKSDPGRHEWYIQQMSQTAQHVVLETLTYLATVDLAPVLPKITKGHSGYAHDMHVVTITTKRQATLPATLRKELGLPPGRRSRWNAGSSGRRPCGL